MHSSSDQPWLLAPCRDHEWLRLPPGQSPSCLWPAHEDMAALAGCSGHAAEQRGGGGLAAVHLQAWLLPMAEDEMVAANFRWLSMRGTLQDFQQWFETKWYDLRKRNPWTSKTTWSNTLRHTCTHSSSWQLCLLSWGKGHLLMGQGHESPPAWGCLFICCPPPLLLDPRDAPCLA